MARRVVPVNGWTPTQKRLIDLLADGQPRTKAELVAQLNIPDDERAVANLQVHISLMRERLRARGLEIVCVAGGRRKANRYQLYRMVRVVNDDE